MSTVYTGIKPRLSFWQIWNMCFGFFGIQFGWSLQMGNMSAIYEFLGATPEEIPGLWLAAPMTGLLVQPIIGYFSDRTWHPRWGRRRPYFLVGAILSSLALFIMPNSSAVWMAAGTLWILDSCINISMEPFRAFVADNLNDKQRSFGYSMQSMFIGAASFIAGFWPGLFLMWFYYSTGVAADIFGGDAKTNSEVYTKGLEHANATSAILNLVTFAFSFTIPFWVGKIGMKMTHTVCLIIGGLGLISVNFIHEPWMLYMSMSMVGIAWASILSMPYSMLSGSLPAEKMGIYMGIFNFFIVLPEIIASLFFGKIMENFLHNDRLTAVLIGGILLCTAGIVCSLIVKESKHGK